MTPKEALEALDHIEQNPIVKFVRDRVAIWNDGIETFPDDTMGKEYVKVVEWLVDASRRGVFQS